MGASSTGRICRTQAPGIASPAAPPQQKPSLLSRAASIYARTGTSGMYPVPQLQQQQTKASQGGAVPPPPPGLAPVKAAVGNSIPPPRSLPTGTRIIPDGATSGHGELTADNGNRLDACLVLIDAASGVRVRKIYIKAGDSFTLKNISPGNYRVYFAIGSDWDSSDNKFKRDASYARFDEPFSYDEVDNGRKTDYVTDLARAKRIP